jgi:triosephosphate isomerase (TIM)
MAGNWKMYKNCQETRSYFDTFKPLVANSNHCDIVICPTFVNLQAAVDAAGRTRIEVGGQNVFWAKEGAYTGEISAEMLQAVGCRWVLVAHSERRHYFGETDEIACKKIVAALGAGLTPVLCVGEVLAEREAGETDEVLRTQLEGSLASLTCAQFERVVIAYEPVWAIGTGRTATPQIAASAHRLIREEIAKSYGPEAARKCRILYGGSVKPDNIQALMAEEEVDGALVGGASLDPKTFATIVNY